MELSIYDRFLLLLEQRNLAMERLLPPLNQACQEAAEAIGHLCTELQVANFREDIEFDELTERFWDSYR